MQIMYVICKYVIELRGTDIIMNLSDSVVSWYRAQIVLHFVLCSDTIIIISCAVFVLVLSSIRFSLLIVPLFRFLFFFFFFSYATIFSSLLLLCLLHHPFLSPSSLVLYFVVSDLPLVHFLLLFCLFIFLPFHW